MNRVFLIADKNETNQQADSVSEGENFDRN